MDMGIVNAGQLVVYDQIEPQLKELCEDVIFKPAMLRQRKNLCICRNSKSKRKGRSKR
jgi:5-methyltetrahydrofolate--homocysteine methyltransferase